MADIRRISSLGRAWKGFRLSVVGPQTTDNDVDTDHRDPNALKSVLPSWQILALAVSAIIGVTIWQGNGLVLHIAGPAGMLTAVGFVAITSISVMESLSEMIILWPVAMGLYEYVRAFVDHDLAIVISLAYWYTWSSVFGTLIVAAAEFSTYWDAFHNSQMWQTLLFYIFCPIFMLVVNCLGVTYYGWLEGIGGIIKFVFVIVGIIFMFTTSGKVGSQCMQHAIFLVTNTLHPLTEILLVFDDQYQHNVSNADNTVTALFLVIPILAYGFLGIESITTTAFEAADRNALRFPSRYVAYLTSLLYFLSALGEAHSVSWENPSLPDLRARSTDQQRPLPVSHSVIVLAALAQGEEKWAAFFTGCMIFFCLSAANTALYIASRTLYGLTRSIGFQDSKWYFRWLSVLGTTTPVSRVPGWALLVSAVAFCWLPFIHLGQGISSQDVLTIFSTTGSVGGVIVWASQCLAYIRCWMWFRHHSRQGTLPQRYDRWRNRWDGSYMSTFSYLQPFPAVLGLVCCCLVVFVFSSATWWNGTPSFRKVATAFAGPLLLVAFYIGLKLHNRRLWVELHPVYTGPLGLSEVLNRLERNAHSGTSGGIIELEEVVEVDEDPRHVQLHNRGESTD